MKIKVERKSYEEVIALPRPGHKNPKKTNLFFRTLLKVVSHSDLKATDFSYRLVGMEKLPDTPCLILMNHSSFIDLEIVSSVFYPHPFNIVCTSDGFVGKEWLMRNLGCIPTKKFVTDTTLIRDMQYALKKKKASVLMYPEASYTFDGTPTALPRGMGTLLKMLNVPVISVHTTGAFARDPLYNCLQKRNVKVSAEIRLLLTPGEIAAKTRPELDALLDREFSFDNFRWQKENQVRITESFRADGLHRILYQCPVCGKEGCTEGKGTEFFCRSCGTKWTLDEYGTLVPADGKSGFPHIPDWYAWERNEVRKELINGTYRLETDVKIIVMVDYKAVYEVGNGHLVQDADGFRLTGCDGKLSFTRPALNNYGLYADYYWYELGDMICIGNNDILYYCFPTDRNIPVAKARLAAEEAYKIGKKARQDTKKAADKSQNP